MDNFTVIRDATVPAALLQHLRYQRLIVDVSDFSRCGTIPLILFSTCRVRLVISAASLIPNCASVASIAVLVNIFRLSSLTTNWVLRQFYDFFLVVHLEIELIWFSKWNYTKVMYLLTRYVPMSNAFFMLYSKSFFSKLTLVLTLHNRSAGD